MASRHDEEKTVRALVARAKRQTIIDPPEGGIGNSQPGAKPSVKVRIDFEGLPICGKAEISVLRLPWGDGPLWEDELDALTKVGVRNVRRGKLTLVLDNVVENEVFSIWIGPEQRARGEAQSNR